ncbi:MAG: glycosyltransferase [Bacteroidales bacterium]|nr:glycosyltransferase [Bacteroidales bacterium]
MNWIDQRILTKFYNANCLLTQGDLDDNFPKHPKRIKVVPNPITSRFPDINPRQTERNNTVLFVGRLTYQKNPEELIEIWHAIKSDGWKLRIIGTGPLEQKCKESVRDKALDGSIEFAGWSNNVGAELRRAKIFVATSRYEGFPLALIEAAANGVVPVSYTTPYGPGDLISHNQDGILVPYGDRNTFVHELKILMDDSSRLQQMSDAAFKKARQYDISVIADRWAGIYESLMQKNRH